MNEYLVVDLTITYYASKYIKIVRKMYQQCGDQNEWIFRKNTHYTYNDDSLFGTIITVQKSRKIATRNAEHGNI